MTMVKPILYILLGFVTGVICSFLTFRGLWVDDQHASGLMVEHTQVRDFVLLNDKTDKDRYCLDYRIALSNVKYLKMQLEGLSKDKNKYVILEMNIEWANEAIKEFQSLEMSDLKYDCETS